MKMAMTVWKNRISPVFDAAHMLLVVEIENDKIINRHYETFYPEWPSRLANRLTDMDVSVLICGAISELPANIIEENGVKLIPFITGDIRQVIDACAKKIPIMPTFLMPGCGHKHHGQNRRGKKHRFRFRREVMVMPRGDGTGPQGQGPKTGKGQGGRKSGKGGGGQGIKTGPRQGRGKGQGKGGGQSHNKSVTRGKQTR